MQFLHFLLSILKFTASLGHMDTWAVWQHSAHPLGHDQGWYDGVWCSEVHQNWRRVGEPSGNNAETWRCPRERTWTCASVSLSRKIPWVVVGPPLYTATEVEAGGSQFQGHPRLHIKILSQYKQQKQCQLSHESDRKAFWEPSMLRHPSENEITWFHKPDYLMKLNPS